MNSSGKSCGCPVVPQLLSARVEGSKHMGCSGVVQHCALRLACTTVR
jgi:hypothetical protein